MLFSRRKRATAVEPEVAHPNVLSNGDSPAAPPADIPVEGSAGPGAHPTIAAPITAAAPPAVPPADWTTDPAGTEGGGAPEGPDPVGRRDADDDLDRFFAALRQVVEDARERLPLDSDDVEDDALDDAESEDEPASTGSGVALSVEAAGTTELAPSTAELVASLEEDRDRWRERAIVWRERAMGADLLVKTLNEHMSDLKVNLDDLRAAMQAMAGARRSNERTAALPPAPSPRRSVIDRLLDPGT